MATLFEMAMDFLKTPVTLFDVTFSVFGIFCTFFGVYLFCEIINALKGGKD